MMNRPRALLLLAAVLAGCNHPPQPASESAQPSGAVHVYRPAVSQREPAPVDDNPHEYEGIRLTPFANSIVFGNGLVQLRFDRKTGAWQSLTADGVSENCIASGKPETAVDFRIDGQWMIETVGSRFTRHRWVLDEKRGAASLEMVYAVADRKPAAFIAERWKDRAPSPAPVYSPPDTNEFELTCTYTLFPKQARIERSATLSRNLSKDFFHSSFRHHDGFLFVLPGVAAGKTRDCTVEVPGPVYTYSFIDSGTKYDELAPTYVDCKTSPDRYPGIIGIQNRREHVALSTWLDTKAEVVYQSYLSGDGKRVSVLLHDMRSERFGDRGTIHSDVQTIVFTPTFRDAQTEHRKLLEARMPLCATNPPWARDMVILEMIPSFYPGGFRGIAEHLGFYRDIGFNTLYLLPHWKGSYSNIDPLAVDPALGTPEELKALVAKAHALGMHVVFDMVIHGFSPDSPLVKQHPEFFTHNEQGLIETHFNWGSVNTDPASAAYVKYMTDLVSHDVREYDIDGYRVDANSYKPANWDPASPRAPWESSSTLPLYRAMYDAARQAKPAGVVFYSEMFGPCWHTVSNLAQDANWAVVTDVFDMMDRGEVNAATYKAGLVNLMDSMQEGVNRIRFCRNHDTCWFFPKHYKGFTPRFLALDAVHFCFGVPLVFAGDRQYPPSLEESSVACEQYRKLIALRTKFPEIAHGQSLLHEVDCDNKWVFAGLRRERDNVSLVIVSLSPNPEPVTLKLDLEGRTLSGLSLRDLHDDSEITLPKAGPCMLTAKPFQVLSGRLAQR